MPTDCPDRSDKISLVMIFFLWWSSPSCPVIKTGAAKEIDAGKVASKELFLAIESRKSQCAEELAKYGPVRAMFWPFFIRKWTISPNLRTASAENSPISPVPQP